MSHNGNKVHNIKYQYIKQMIKFYKSVTSVMKLAGVCVYIYMFLIFSSPYTCDEINSNSLRTRRNLRVESLRSNSRAMPFCNDWIRMLSDWELPSLSEKKLYEENIQHSQIIKTVISELTHVNHFPKQGVYLQHNRNRTLLTLKLSTWSS